MDAMSSRVTFGRFTLLAQERQLLVDGEPAKLGARAFDVLLAVKKRCKEAFAQAEIAERRIAGGAAPLSWPWLAVTYATCRDAARARHELEQNHALEDKRYVDPVTFAAVHGALGEVDLALGWYEKAFADRTPNKVYAAILPGFSPELVGTARFQAIVDRMGFAQRAS
jgi:hypothetical protein